MPLLLNQGLFTESDKILLAVSGGIDSMVMLSLFCLIKDVNIGIAHVNYGLRDTESDLDELLVKTTAEKHRIEAFFLHPNIHSLVEEKGISIQEAARDSRYEWFKHLSIKHGFTKIATAHHREDQAETILLNLIRGSGLQGLTGISSRNNNIIRPLLRQTKEDIIQYAIQHHINFREDASNSENKYTRNQIRNLIMPSLLSINPKASEHISHTGNILNNYAELVKYFIDRSKEDWVVRNQEEVRIIIGHIPFPHLEIILFELLKSTKINESQIQNIIEAFTSSNTGASFSTPTHSLVLDRGLLIIRPSSEKLNIAIPIHMGKNHVSAANISLNIEEVDFPEEWSTSESVVYLNMSKLRFPLFLRNWKPGDRMAPLGMAGQTKKIQDILTDKKVNKFEKNSTLLLTVRSEICWLLGYTISDHFKAVRKDRVVRIKFE